MHLEMNFLIFDSLSMMKILYLAFLCMYKMVNLVNNYNYIYNFKSITVL